MSRPAKTIAATGNVKQAFSAIVTVGPEDAAKLTKKLGRKVEVGEQFDLGTVSLVHNNRIINWWYSFKIKFMPNSNAVLFR